MLALSPLGSEFRANTNTTGTQVFADVASDVDGDFVVVWRSDGQDGDAGGIYGQRFNAAGAAQGGEFRVNTTTAGNQMNPSVAMDNVGNFVVVWEDSTTGKGIMGQRFSAAGVAQGGEFRVISSSTGGGLQTEVAMNGSGAFVVTYRGTGTNSNDRGAFARLYNASGVAAGSAFRVNTDLQTMTDTSIDMNDAGSFVVAWSQYRTTPTGVAVPNIFARRYNAAGTALDAQPVTVNTYDGGEEGQPTIAMLPGGGYVVAYTDLANTHDGLGNGTGVYAQVFDDLSNKVGPEFRAGTYLPGDQSSPSIAADPDGPFAIAWHGFAAGSADPDIHVQFFDGSGNPIAGSEQRVNTYLSGNQFVPAASMSGNGRLTIAWHSAGQDPDASFGVYAQRYTAVADVTPPIVTTPQFLFDRRPAPALRFEFNKDLASASVQNTDLELTNQVTGQTIAPGAINAVYDNTTRTITFTFPGLSGGALPDGNYRARLLDGSVTDTDGTAMENEYVFSFYALAGDANRDRHVDQADEAILNANFGNINATFPQGDFNYDGTVNNADRAVLDGNWMLWLPAQGTSIFLGYSGGKTVNELRAEPGSRLAIWSGTATQLTMQYRFPTAAVSSMSVSGDYPGELSLIFVGAGGVADGVTFAGSNVTFAGGFSVNHSLLDHIVFDGQSGWDALTLLAGADVRLRGDQELGTLAIAANASLDIADNTMLIRGGNVGSFQNGAYTGITGMIQTGRTPNCTWDGTGIVTSMADAAAGLTGVGIGKAADLLFLSPGATGVWDGHTVDASTVIVKYTYAGDANLDGLVDAADYGMIDNYYQFPGTSGYANGDFNFDGVIDAGDYGYIDNSFQLQGGRL